MISTIFVLATLGLQAEAPPPSTILVSRNEKGGACRTLWDGEEVSQDQLHERATAFAGSHRRIRILGEDNAPYRCIGKVIYDLQVAGVTGVVFVSDPSASTTESGADQ